MIAFLAKQAARLDDNASNTTISIASVSAVAAGLIVTFGANMTNGKVLTIGTKTYTFQDTLTNVDGNIKIGANAQATILNLSRAINASGGTAGTDYATANTIHPTVSATAGASTLTLAAKVAGSAGNSIAVTTDVVSATAPNGTLVGGADISYSTAITATSHGISNAEGPYRVASTTTIPGGLSAGQDYWVSRVSANAIRLVRDKADVNSGPYVQPTSAGSGTITLSKGASSAAVFELLRRHKSQVIADATDIDNLA